MTVMALSGIFRMKQISVLSLLGVVLVLASCRTEDYRNTINERLNIAEQRAVEARQPAPARRYNPLTVTDSVWTGAKAIRMRNGMPLPERVEGQRSVAIISTTPMSVRAIASAIHTQTGIPVRIGKGADEGGGEDDDNPQSVSASAKTTAVKKPASGAAAPAPTIISGGGMRLAYEGSLSGLLERVSSHFGISWRYDGGAISISKYETRVFTLDALPGTQTVKDGMKEATNSSSSSSGSAEVAQVDQAAADQTSSFQVDFKFWDEVGKTVEAILGGVGSYSLSPSSGTLTVVTTPEIMRTVSEYLSSENQRLSRQVAINIEVFTVDSTEGEDFNNKFAAAVQGSLTRAKLDFTGAASPATTNTTTDLGRLAIAVIDPTDGGVTSVFSLLSSVGKTARVAQFPMTTLNNRPVARRIGQDRTYLASVQTNTSQSFQDTTLTPGIIRDGFSIQVTPRILEDGRILLQYSLSLIDLLSIEQFASGGNQIQLPRTATRVFVQQTMLRSGSTLVLGGFDQDQIEQSSQGIGNAYNYLLGGGVANTRIRQVLFIAMTPQEISLPRTENE